MAATTYTYSIPNDMPDGEVNASTLHEEVSESSITIALDSIDTDGTSLEIVFKAPLPTADKSVLDGDATGPAGGLLAAHDNSPAEEPVQKVALNANSINTIELQEVSPGVLLYHNFSLPIITVEVDSTEAYADLVLPFDFYFLSIEYWAGPGSGAKFGDKICSAVDPQRNLTQLIGPYGTIASDATAGQNEIGMSSISMYPGIMQPGYVIQMGDTTSKQYTIASLSKASGIITLAENLELDATAGDIVYRTICLGYKMHVFPTAVPIEYGQEKIGASKLPAGMAFRVHYIACDTAGRSIAVNIMGAVHEE